MENIVFADSWQPVFAGFGLKSFDDFFDYRGAEIIGKNNKRDISILTFGDGPGRKVFFLKRFHHPHFKDTLFTLRNFGQFCSQGACEWKNANLLLENGIETYRPVCYGQQTKWGLETKSFFVTEKLWSTSLLDFVLQRWRELKRHQQEKIVAAIAKLIRQIHDLNVGLPDLSIWHIFIREDSLEDGCQLSVIDLHRMVRSVRNRNKKIKDLGKLYWSMSPEYFDDELKDLFICAYMGDNWTGSKAALTRRIQRRANVMAKRRKLQHYYQRAKILSAR